MAKGPRMWSPTYDVAPEVPWIRACLKLQGTGIYLGHRLPGNNFTSIQIKILDLARKKYNIKIVIGVLWPHMDHPRFMLDLMLEQLDV